jgi:hypothetical protein
MTHRNVETLIGRLATDAALRRRFEEDRAGLLRQLHEQGYELTPFELDALASTDASALRALAEGLDRRIRRLDLEKDPHRK